jgi:hypothetical protein
MGEMNPCLSNIPKSIEAEAGRAEQEKQPSVEDWERPTSVATGGGMSNPDPGPETNRSEIHNRDSLNLIEQYEILHGRITSLGLPVASLCFRLPVLL